MLQRISLPLAFIALGGTHLAEAGQSDEGPWSTTLRIGTEVLPHGTFQAGVSGTIADMGPFNSALAGQAATTRLDALTFDDIFRVGPSMDLELGYRLLPHLEPFVRLNYSQLRGENARIGDAHPSGGVAPEVIRAKFDDLQSWSLDLGARYFFGESGPFSSYFAAQVGASRSAELRAHVRLGGKPAPAAQNILLPRETRFNAGIEFGISYDISDQTSLRFSLGAGYQTSRHEQSRAYDPLGIDEVRVTDQQWLLPIALGLTYRF